MSGVYMYVYVHVYVYAYAYMCVWIKSVCVAVVPEKWEPGGYSVLELGVSAVGHAPFLHWGYQQPASYSVHKAGVSAVPVCH